MFRKYGKFLFVGGALLLGALLMGASPVGAEEAALSEAVVEAGKVRTDANILWTCIAAFLVFFMQAGFALVETGLTRAKNACNILMKNLVDFCIGSVLFFVVGAGLMFGATNGGWFGTTGFLWDGAAMATVKDAAAPNVGFSWAFLLFQTMFCATAATIVSGAVAERIKFSSYLIYTIVITGFVYPIAGHWNWGALYLGNEGLFMGGMLDFAGSTLVHSVGGWSALAGAIVLGPRLGKYTKDGKVRPIPGHNMAYTALGVFILWLGWFGFNPGSTVSIGSSMAYIAITTNLSAAVGGLTAMLTSWVLFKKPDTSMTFNGVLAGLVAITAGCDIISPAFAMLTGGIAGVLVVLSVLAFDKIKIDDPVGAVSVHAICGSFGTIAVGLWATEKGLFTGGGTTQLIAQLKGVAVYFIWSFGIMISVFYAMKVTIGLRVSEREEREGLDIHEHGNQAYPADVAAAPIGIPVGGMAYAAPASEPGYSRTSAEGAR